MDSVDAISYINDVLNSNFSNEDKLERIEDIINEYFNELIDDKEGEF